VAGEAPGGGDRHPAVVYLARLAPSGRRSQASALDQIARLLSGGELDWPDLPWHLVRYQHVAAVRSWVADHRTPSRPIDGRSVSVWVAGNIREEFGAKVRTAVTASGGHPVDGSCPVEAVADQATSACGRFSGAPSRSAMERFFFLDDRERALLERRRRDHNRLGFALQLGTVRFLGTFLADPLDVPREVIEYSPASWTSTRPASTPTPSGRRRPTSTPGRSAGSTGTASSGRWSLKSGSSWRRELGHRRRARARSSIERSRD
jgi:hypothetical protein